MQGRDSDWRVLSQAQHLRLRAGGTADRRLTGTRSHPKHCCTDLSQADAFAVGFSLSVLPGGRDIP